MKKILFVWIIGWIACSILAFGLVNGHKRWFSNCEVPRLGYGQRQNLGIIVMMTVVGPAGVVVESIVTNFAEHGLDYSWGWKAEQGRGCK